MIGEEAAFLVVAPVALVRASALAVYAPGHSGQLDTNRTPRVTYSGIAGQLTACGD